MSSILFPLVVRVGIYLCMSKILSLIPISDAAIVLISI